MSRNPKDRTQEFLAAGKLFKRPPSSGIRAKPNVASRASFAKFAGEIAQEIHLTLAKLEKLAQRPFLMLLLYDLLLEFIHF